MPASALKRQRQAGNDEHRPDGQAGMTGQDIYRLALRASPQPVSLSRLCDDTLVDVSDSFCRLAGGDRSSLIGCRVADLGLWVDPTQWEALVRSVENTEAVQDFEASVRNADGEIHVHLIAASRLDTQPEPLLLSIGYDITPRATIEQALAESELRYRCFVEAMPLGVLITQNGEMMFANPKAAEMSGYARGELAGRSFLPLIHEEDRARVADLHARRMAGEVEVSSYTLRIWRKDGALRHWQVHVQTVNWSGAPSGLSLISDITDQVQSNIRLRELSSIVEQASDAIMLTATDGAIQYVNPGFESLTGYASEEVLGKTPAALKSGTHDPSFYRQLWETISAGKPFHAQVVNRRKDGTLYHAVKTITPMLDGAGRIVSYVNIDKDFTTQHEIQQRTTHLALHDHLTGLPNRPLLMERIGQAIAHHAREQLSFSVMFIDLDGFKSINDHLGHQAGDEVLKQVAFRLRHRVRGVDTVARIGGDEFVVLLTSVDDRTALSTIATELIEAIREPISLLCGVCQVGASVGIGVFPRDADTNDGVLQRADGAMYEAKRAGGNGFRFAADG